MVTRFWNLTGTNIITLTTLKVDISYNLLRKYYIFKVTVNLPPRGTPIVIVAQYYEQYTYQ